MSGDISLTSAQRKALIDLRDNAALSSRTQLRLSSGRKINTVIDDSVNYFKAKTLSDRSKDFSDLKAEMGQALSHLEVTLEAISGLENILGQMKGIIEASRSQSKAERALANKAIRNLGNQLRELINDASYGGANLLNSTSLGRIVRFGLRDTSILDIKGLNLIRGAAADDRMFTVAEMWQKNGQQSFLASILFSQSLTIIGDNNSRVSVVANAVKLINGAVANLRGHAQALGSNVAILQVRESFTDRYVTFNKVGAEKYTLADLNEEGANLVALQTRQQLGIQALAVAGQQHRQILTLLQ